MYLYEGHGVGWLESEACRLRVVTERGAKCDWRNICVTLGALIEFGGVSIDEGICEQDQTKKSKRQYEMKIDVRRYFPIPKPMLRNSKMRINQDLYIL